MSETHGIGLRGQRVDEIRKVGDSTETPDGAVALFAEGAPIPDGWEVIHEREASFIPGPAPEGARRFGDLSEADAYAAVERFMSGEPVADLAHAYAVPVGMIEGAIRAFVALGD